VRRLAVALVAILILIPSPASAEVTQADLARAWDEAKRISAQLEGELAELEAVEARQWDFEVRAEVLQKDIEDRERRMVLAELAVRERAVALYVSYGTGTSPAIVSVEGLTDASTRDAYLKALTNEDRDVVTELEFLQQDRERLRAELEALAAEQEDVRQQIGLLAERITGQLEVANAEYQNLWETWQREEAARVAAAEAERRRREAAARAAAAAASGGASSASVPAGTRVCPVAGPHTFRNSWGEPRSGGRSHTGLDMIAATGTPLVAIESGSIWSPNWHYLGGIGLYLRGDSGDVYYYAHMSGYGPGIANGARVWAGQVVGYNGATGNAATPHLHLGYQPGGGALTNPYQLMVRLCR
jgi:murein DD-endopeptidase MepM/ murein hydrolase activator NlpD